MRRSLAALLLTCAGTAGAADTAVIIDSTRSFVPNSIPRNAAWLGLFCRKLECELRPVGVDVGTGRAKNILDEDESLDSVAIDGKPRAVFANLPLKPGKVVTWHAMNDEQYFGSPQYESCASWVNGACPEERSRWCCPG
ncbi:hypothetical protein [Pseudoduganella sp. R-34]|uniref:hypothetical protein n=1 Tax=Pseudoduganella sp. R-34 TaxID=3404062 RepID=UPI003CEC8CFA